MDEKTCDMFMKDTKTELSECFRRIGELETKQAVGIEKENQILEKMDKLYTFFERHDKAEMQKYGEMNSDIRYLTRFMYIATGIGLVLGFVGIDNIIKLLGGH